MKLSEITSIEIKLEPCPHTVADFEDIGRPPYQVRDSAGFLWTVLSPYSFRCKLCGLVTPWLPGDTLPGDTF